MATVYRYLNTDTNEYDYIGIVYSENRTLDQRVYEHSLDLRNSWRMSTCSNIDLTLKEGECRYGDYELSKLLQDSKWIDSINKIVANMGDLEKYNIIKWKR